MIDLLGSIKVELKDDTALSTWAVGRIRGEELAPGDAKGPGEYKRWVRIQRVGGLPRLPRAPVQFPRFAITTAGINPEDAMVGYGYATDALHLVGCRVRANGFGIYISFEDTAPDSDADPFTKQPTVTFIAQVIAPTFAIPV